jgi:hypothetical protein
MTARDATPTTTTSPTTSPTTSWRESATALLSLLDPPGGGVRCDDGEVERACAAVLRSTDVIDCEDVRRIVETIRLRSLIRLGRFDAVVASSAGRDDEDAVATAEAAYALYRSGDYEACRKLCALRRRPGGGGRGGDSRGLMHVHAQALYRLGRTDAADCLYSELLSSAAAHADADEREDALSNALANRIANHTPGVVAPSSSPSGGDWLEGDADLRGLVETYGRVQYVAAGDGGREDDTRRPSTTPPATMQNYDLAYNLATYLLVSRSSRPRSCIVEAMNLLLHAEGSATSTIDDDDGGVADPRLAEREANPIRANLALSRLLLGGASNETEAYRAYLTLLARLRGVSSSSSSSSSGGGEGSGSGGGGAPPASSATAIAEGNLLAVASNNIACLRDGKEGVLDALGRVPAAASRSRGGGAVVSGATTPSPPPPLAGATPHQARVALYNRALLLARMGNVRECGDALDVLRASLRVSYHGDESERRGGGGGGGPKTGGSPNRADGGAKKRRKKRGETRPAAGAAAGVSVGAVAGAVDVLAAKPRSDVESIAWDARADLLESELHRISQSSSPSSNVILDGAIAKLDAVITSSSHDDVGGALSYAKSQLLLHRAAVNDPSSEWRRSKAAIGTLESLPSSVRSCPGAIVTLASLQEEAASVESALSLLGDDRRAKLVVAEFRIERGQYHAAVDLLRDIVEEEKGNVGEATAMLVKALSYTDLSKAEEYAALLQEPLGGVMGGSELSGEALEFMDIPRFAKQASLESHTEGNDVGSSKVRKLISATGRKGRSNMG